jgi:hypothetical protein
MPVGREEEEEEGGGEGAGRFLQRLNLQSFILISRDV